MTQDTLNDFLVRSQFMQIRRYAAPEALLAVPFQPNCLGQLPGSDPEVTKLVAKLGMDPSRIVVGALPVNDFIATVFGLFAYGGPSTLDSGAD